MDMNTEPSQNEQIVWDDPTARQERAKLADNLQWPGSPTQRGEEALAPPPVTAEDGRDFRDSMTDSELVEMGRTLNATQNCYSQTNQYRSVCQISSLIVTLWNSALRWAEWYAIVINYHLLKWLQFFCPAACDVINQQMGMKVATPPAKRQQEAILTPEAPSIAFPLPKLVAPEPQVEVK